MINISLNHQTTQLAEEASEILAKQLIRNDNIRTVASVVISVAIGAANVAVSLGAGRIFKGAFGKTESNDGAEKVENDAENEA